MIVENFSALLSAAPSFVGAVGFLLAAFVQEIVAPIPSPLLLIGAAYFFKTAFSLALFFKTLLFVSLPIAIGSTLGTIVIYLICYKGGKPAIERFRKYLRFSWEDVEKMERRLSEKNSDKLILFVSRCIPFVPTTVFNILGGLIRMNLWAYSLLTFLGIFIRVTGLMIIIKIFGHAVFTNFFNL